MTTAPPDLTIPSRNYNPAAAPSRLGRGLLILVGFIVARLALAAIPAANPQGGILVDSEKYLSLASGLAGEGKYFDAADQDFIWPAGYPAFIALASGWSAPSPVAVAVVQLILTGAIAVLVVAYAGRVGDRGRGLAAGWMYVLLPTAALWALTVMSETLFTALLLLACLVWLLSVSRGQLWLGVLAGFLLGLAAFVRPIGLALVPVWALLAFLALRRQHGWKRGLAMGLAIAVGTALIVVPWSLRNLSAHRRFAFSGVGERTFFNFNVAEVKAQAEGTTRNQAASELGTSGSDLADSLQIIARYPVPFLMEQGKGVFRTLLGLEAGSWARLFGLPEGIRGGLGVVSSILEGDSALAVSRLKSVLVNPQTGPFLALVSSAEVLSLLLYGLTAVFLLRGGAKGDWGIQLLLWTAVVLVVLPGAAGQARFRTPIEPLLAVLAAGGAASLFRRRKRTSPSSVGPPPG
jgi:4-amino-4-deoxy-L-arabinose transferase-like glycosyltransferase